MIYYVYILHSIEHDSFYVGQTDNMNGRLQRHNNGEVQSTARYRPWIQCIGVEKPTRSEAMILEKKLKNLSKERLRRFIQKYGGYLPK